MNRRIEAAVIENGPLSILRDGLPYDRCDIGIVTDLEGAETLGHYDIRDADQLPKVLRTQVDVVLDEGVAVLNAGDARIAALASLCDGDTILYALEADNAVLQEHVGAGGRAVRLQGRAAELLAPDAAPQRIELGAWGEAERAERVLPAVAAAWALGIAPALIRAGIETFDAELARNPNPIR
jgi:cyanophycin synthetase